jgi:hypothetical protein
MQARTAAPNATLANGTTEDDMSSITIAMSKNEDPQIEAVSAVNSHSASPKRTPVSPAPSGVGGAVAGDVTSQVLLAGLDKGLIRDNGDRQDLRQNSQWSQAVSG